jgi:hypothetical protein
MAASPSSKVTRKKRSTGYEGSLALLSMKYSTPALAASMTRTPLVVLWFIEALVSRQKRKIIFFSQSFRLEALAVHDSRAQGHLNLVMKKFLRKPVTCQIQEGSLE